MKSPSKFATKLWGKVYFVSVPMYLRWHKNYSMNTRLAEDAENYMNNKSTVQHLLV